MNELLEAKLTISKIKTQLLDLAGELVADDLKDKAYAIHRILRVVEHIEEHDVGIKEIIAELPKSSLS
ncbi:hypothetical protein [Neobacillus sp. CF12]|uniref:hypothetical protein n=1 Tax=Neobacillus sp. CF12 TaxID=3055864 RepID=UPI0025A2F893|nr:hypothetical protein [Neobacillus sp. CF12]MDM5326808.1 hypothetical protein [Neobacillus sp. CF12]